MTATLPEQQEICPRNRASASLATIRSCLLAWEIYPILLVAAFLRLYRLDTSAFSGDQSTLFLLAYNAVQQGLIPATSNGASILTMHPPATIFLLMLPALFSSDPIWGVVMTALFNVAAVLITYIFTRRYYGRLAGSIAALLFATAGTSIVFSRFIWQPNLLAPFVTLYIYSLFRGVVERRKGWLFPALFLLGLMYQLHELTLLLAVPLLAAILLAPHTIRLRDLLLACTCLLLLFAPYLVWEASSGFADVHTALDLTGTTAHFDTQALTFYMRLLRSYYYDERFLPSSYFDPLLHAFYDPKGSAGSAVFKLLPLLNWSYHILVLLLAGGFITAGALIVRGIAKTSERLHSWWSNLRADPERCGLVVLIVWQLAPPLILARHSAPVHQHYLFLTIPGPFILIGLCVSRLLNWLRQRGQALRWQGLRYAIYTLTALLLGAQLAGSTAALSDTVHGINSHVFGYNDLGSLQHALREADQVAQQQHFNRIYITISASDDSLTGLPFLATSLRTPNTLFDSTHCLVLPAPASGPALLLARSSDSLALSLLNSFATATLIDRPALLGTSPLRLYIVRPLSHARQASASDDFVNNLQLLQSYPQQLPTRGATFLVTGWTLQHAEQPAARTSYTYMLTARAAALSIASECTLTSMRAGDQLLTTFNLPRGAIPPQAFRLTAQLLVSSPYIITRGPLRFETVVTQGQPETLRTRNGNDSLVQVPGEEQAQSLDHA
jgi:4-amino-4-deoxy-L-arabinose transferase-like glycosyltransferase